MGLSGSSACVKYLLFIFNLIFVITGITILTVGAVVQAAYHTYAGVLEDRFLSVPALLIATGAIILIISFFGCCGAVKENHCMIVTFSVFLVLIFILELAAGIAGYVLKDAAVGVLKEKLNHTMYETVHVPADKDLWSDIQTDFSCCGTNNASDWKQVYKNDSLPYSCCNHSEHLNCTLDSHSLHTSSCVKAMGDVVVKNAVLLGGVGIGIAFIQFLGIILACCLARSIRNHYETV